jgi:hypothetical protein
MTAGFTHERGYQGDTNVWLTPPSIIEKLGGFDLDPCAAPEPRPWATAARHIALPEDGLTAEWQGRVWCNPPYGPHVAAWMKRMVEHSRGTALIFARTETEAWQDVVWPGATAILFMRGRIRFHRPDGQRGDSASAPSALIAFGEDDAIALAASGIEGKLVYPNETGTQIRRLAPRGESNG